MDETIFSLLEALEKTGDVSRRAELMNQVNARTAHRAGMLERNFVESIDACMRLPLLHGQWWNLDSGVSGGSPSSKAIIKLEGTAQYAKILPVAMLKAWWEQQSK